MKKKTKALKFQASSISRILKCPGSATLESKLPDRLRYFAFKDAAEFGTFCHAVGEAKLMRGEYPEISEHPRKDEILYTGETYAAAVKAHKLTRGKLHVEEKFRATICGVNCVAKSDAFYVDRNHVRKFDLKSGNFDYSESAPLQMIFAARLWLYVNSGDNKGGGAVYTVQPNFYNEARRVVRNEFFYDRAEFVEFIADLKQRQKEVNSGDHCKMCPAILTCPNVKKLTEEFFEMAKKATKEDLNFAEIYEKKNAVIAFLEALDNYLKTELENGKIFPNIGLVEYSGHRRWIDAGEVAVKLEYLKDKIYKPRELKTPAQMEKLAGKENIAGLYESPKLRKVAIKENPFSPVFDE